MYPFTEEEEYELSGNDGDEEEEDDDNDLDEDLEAIRRACMLTGTNPEELNQNNDGSDYRHRSSDFDSDSDEDDDDLELLRNIRSRFLNSSDVSEALSLKPSSTLPPDVSDEEGEDDFLTLLAVQKRFSAYENDIPKKATEQVSSSCKSVKETCNDSVLRTDAYERSSDIGGSYLDTHPLSNSAEGQPSVLIEGDQSDSCRPSMLPSKCSSFPKSAQVFMDAIKKNRSSQKFLRSKLIQIEAKIEENKQLKKSVKIFKDFQGFCKRRTGEALSQNRDPRVQLILVKSSSPSGDLKARDKKTSALFYGPAKNAHVANYKMAMKEFLRSLDRKKWSKVEKKALEKGIRQQFQEMVLQSSVDESSCSERAYGDSTHIDDILASIKDLEITPQKIREFLPKVKWEQLASLYVAGRSGGECESRWLNWEDPLINHKSWTGNEEKNLVQLVQEKGINNWFDIAVSLGTNRTPFQCLAHYQRSLNGSILEREWTKDEDAKLRSAVEEFGEGDWQSVAFAVGRRTGTQCSNRWKKSLHPSRKREGRWTPEEDKRLKVAQMLFGPKNWNKTAQFVPGRTQAQCRDRYVNCLEPSLKWGEWTEEEDSRLTAAIEEHGHCWSKVAACVPQRTDNMCWRRWKVLFPDEVSLLKEEKKIKKAFMCNFVDRETERPALGPRDFLPPIVTSTKTLTYPSKRNGKLSKVSKKIISMRLRSNSKSCSKVPGINNCDAVETPDGHVASNKKNKVCKQKRRRQEGTDHERDTHKEPSEMSCSDQIVGTSDGDDITLACFLRDKLKKRKQGPFVPSSVNTKKQKLVVSGFSVQDCPADSIQKGSELHPDVVQLHDGNKILSFSQDDEFMVPCDDRVSERLQPCNVESTHLDDKATIVDSDNGPGGVKLVKGLKVSLQEPVVRVNPESDRDTDNVHLTYFRKKKLKNRHPQTASSSPEACCPSSAVTGSESLSNGVKPNKQKKLSSVAFGNQTAAVDLGKQPEVDHCEPVRERVDVGEESDHVAGDMTLACFLRGKSNKRPRQSHRGDIQKSR